MATIPMELPVNLPDATGREKSKMAVSKLTVPVKHNYNRSHHQRVNQTKVMIFFH